MPTKQQISEGVITKRSLSKMVTNTPPLRINEECYNALLNYGFERNPKAKQRRRRNIYDGYSSTKFLLQEIQPKTTRNYTVDLASDDVDRHCSQGRSQDNLSMAGSNRRFSPPLVSECIQKLNIQPTKVTRSKDNECDKKNNISEAKKRPRSSHVRRETTIISRETKDELRIEGETMNDIIGTMRTKCSSMGAKESSVFLKGIRKLSTSKSENEMEVSLLLLNSLEDLVQTKGSSWKRIRIQECSPCILDILLASPYCQNFEEISIVGICDDDDYQPNDHNSISTQEESSQESKFQSSAPTSSLIVSLLRKTTQIRELVLKNCNLDNFDLIHIMNILCSHPNHPITLERLDLRFNKFTPIAIQSILAVHLRSSLHSLKTLNLRQGVRCFVHRNIRNAILQSLRCNRVVLESIDVFDWDKSVQYLLDVNRAKRRFIFCNNDRFPRTLWPLLLEQALVANEDDNYDVPMRKSKSPPLPSLFGPRRRKTCSARRQASVVYHIFRNGGPMLLEQHPSIKHPASFESN